MASTSKPAQITTSHDPKVETYKMFAAMYDSLVKHQVGEETELFRPGTSSVVKGTTRYDGIQRFIEYHATRVPKLRGLMSDDISYDARDMVKIIQDTGKLMIVPSGPIGEIETVQGIIRDLYDQERFETLEATLKKQTEGIRRVYATFDAYYASNDLDSNPANGLLSKAWAIAEFQSRHVYPNPTGWAASVDDRDLATHVRECVEAARQQYLEKTGTDV